MFSATDEGGDGSVTAIQERGGYEIITAQTKGEIDVAISTAKRYPRSIAGFRDEAISMATLDEDTAASCMYALPRGGKDIEGTSVRLAEICATAYGNLRYGGRVVAVEDRYVVAQGICHDLEKNVMFSAEVKRRITNRKGDRFNDDMIAVTSNAAISIAIRNAIFRVIPLALVKPVYAAARATAIGTQQTLNQKRHAMVGHVKKMGLTEERVLAAVGRASIEEITLDDLAHLRGLLTAIREDQTTIDDAFPEVKTDPAKAKNGAKTKVGALADPLAAKTEAAPEPTTTETKPPSGMAIKGARQDCLNVFAKLTPQERKASGVTHTGIGKCDDPTQLLQWKKDCHAVLDGRKTAQTETPPEIDDQGNPI